MAVFWCFCVTTNSSDEPLTDQISQTDRTLQPSWHTEMEKCEVSDLLVVCVGDNITIEISKICCLYFLHIFTVSPSDKKMFALIKYLLSG